MVRGGTRAVVAAALAVARSAWAQPAAAPATPAPASAISAIDQYTVVLGVLLPLVIAAINREAWTGPLKALAALAICVVAAVFELLVKGQFDVQHLGSNLLTIFFLVVTTYKGFWQPTGITDAVSKATG